MHMYIIADAHLFYFIYLGETYTCISIKVYIVHPHWWRTNKQSSKQRKKTIKVGLDKNTAPINLNLYLLFT